MRKEQKGLIPQGDEKTINNMNVEQTEQDKRRAAYALNLCTVSVSQIIDYEDLNILEQEYEMILNNLNLENFPKDEVLLSILKQILDTITFFRIYEGDKQMLDKKYQHKMKNAIWSAIPNFTFVAGGNPWAFAVSGIAAVGMGYMNYRKEKAKILLENEEVQWQLQKSAIEQFNGLRRELFDTAWRLSDKYGFKDEYRLTEKQISAYNRILMDPIPLRKFERLYAIKEFFIAYPPFWYYLGNAAHDVAKIYDNPDYQDPNTDYRQKSILYYYSLAEEYFGNFLTYDHSLLRTDYIRSSCCLEYAALLLEKKNSEYDKVKQLIEEAEKCSSDALDVLQICAMYSLRIDDKNTAERLLRKLVIEGFNTTTNAQLLSYVYLNVAISDKKLFDDNTIKYKELIQFADGNMLIPWVENVDMLNEKGVTILLTRFLDKQKERIQKQFNAVVDKIVEVHAIEYNKQLFQPRNDYYLVDDSFYLDSEESINNRKYEYNILSQNQTEWSIFVNNLKNRNIALVLDNQINKVLCLLSLLVSQALKRDIEMIYSVDKLICHNNVGVLQLLSKLKTKIDSDIFDIDNCHSLLHSSCSFTYIMSSYIFSFKNEAVLKIAEGNNFNDLISIESELADFCKTYNFPSPEVLCEKESIRTIKENGRQFVNVLNYFGGADDIRKSVKIEQELKDKLESFEKSKKLYNSEGVDTNDIVFTTDEELLVKQRNKLSKKDLTIITQYGNILAYFHDNKAWYNRYRDLYFYRKGLILLSSGTVATKKLEYYNYNAIGYDSSDHLLFADINGVKSEIYSSDSVNVRAIYELIKELSRISLSNNK